MHRIKFDDFSDYEKGIVWSIGSIAENRMVFMHTNKYYIQQLKNVTGNSIYEQIAHKNNQYVLKTNRIDINSLIENGWTTRNADTRQLPKIQNYNLFIKAYIELHGCLNYSSIRQSRDKTRKWKTIRLRIYGNELMLQQINELLCGIIGVGIKKLQPCNNEKTKVIYYQSKEEIKMIYDFFSKIDVGNIEYWKDFKDKIDNPDISIKA